MNMRRFSVPIRRLSQVLLCIVIVSAVWRYGADSCRTVSNLYSGMVAARERAAAREHEEKLARMRDDKALMELIRPLVKSLRETRSEDEGVRSALEFLIARDALELSRMPTVYAPDF